MKIFILKHGAGTLVALMLATGVASAQMDVDLSKSTISATSKQMNVPVDGKFRKFSATVDFDPAKPTAGKAQFDVDVASYDLGDEAFNKEVRGKDWFDTTAYPKAAFVSTAITAASDTYIVSGKLTIKGKTFDVVIPVHYKRDGAVQVFDGTLPIKRRQFNIGQGEWGDTSVVADDVQIKFHIVSSATK